MSESTNTLAGLLLLNDANATAAEATDILNDAPVLRALFAQPASQGGTLHKFNRYLTAPGAGFRLIGEGITNAAGTFEQVSVTCALLDATCTRDMGDANAYRKGAVAFMDKEGMASMRAAFFAVERAIFQASLNKQFAGFPGNAFYDQITADTQVIDAGGSGGSSVYLMRTGEDAVSLIAGNEGRITMSTEDAVVQAHDATNRPYAAYMRAIMGWFGLQIGSKYDAVRIVNLDATTGHTLTDAMIYAAIAKFPATKQPNLIVMNPIKRAELQASRTAVNATGAPAPLPTEVNGIQIVVTDAIPVNEAAINTTTTTTTTSTQA